ncbi:glycoside hydrolase family 3 protein [Streptomyces sp. NPDC091377]|uniref:glycoside hydrolase family 3 protein n=1 Tax=Streptomyces sp. NPDC091377 TaxID=3365995 RepID=UPI0038074A46
MRDSDGNPGQTVPGTAAVDHLLGRMSLREKVGQLNQRLYGWQAVERTQRGGFRLTRVARAELDRWGGLGALYGLFRADAWSGRTWTDGIRPQERAEVAALVQEEVRHAGQHGIGALLTEEAPHGHQALGATLLPTNLSLAAGWDPALVAEASAAVAAELSASGVHLALVSALDLLRDARWGRAEECFGEDPLLAAELTRAVVCGMQGDRRGAIGAGGVGVVVKHLAAQGEATGGRNGQSSVIGPRDLRELHLPPVRAAVEAGALGFMAAYNDIDGVPCCANRALITGFLRDECDFDGIVMGDGLAVDRLTEMTDDPMAGAVTALEAGVDLSLWDESFVLLESAAAQDRHVAELVDAACRRMLTLKQRMGLLAIGRGEEDSDPRGPVRERVTVTGGGTRAADIGNHDAARLSRRLARQAMVLLHNDGGVLPLTREARGKVVVAGPNGLDVTAMLGDYVPPLPEGAAPGLYAALREALPASDIVWAPGLPTPAQLKGADLVVLALGGTSHRAYDDEFAANGALIAKAEATSGEGVDMADVSLPEGQDVLAAALRQVVTCPIVAVVIAGRPHVLTTVVENTDAVLWAGYPGPFGGRAIADALLGTEEPVGLLPFTLPSHPGAVPVRYNDRHPAQNVYRDAREPVLFPFGFGLRYHQVVFENLTAAVGPATVRVSVDVGNTTNTGTEAIVPLFAHRAGGRVLPRRRELLAHRRIPLPPGARTTVVWDLPVRTCFAEGALHRARTDLYVEDLHTPIHPYSTPELAVRPRDGRNPL